MFIQKVPPPLCLIDCQKHIPTLLGWCLQKSIRGEDNLPLEGNFPGGGEVYTQTNASVFSLFRCTRRSSRQRSCHGGAGKGERESYVASAEDREGEFELRAGGREDRRLGPTTSRQSAFPICHPVPFLHTSSSRRIQGTGTGTVPPSDWRLRG